MKNIHNTSGDELPSIGKLIKSTVLAIVLASIILVTVVLPAEYGIDPTGFGEFVGLRRMGEIKTSLAEEAAKETAGEGIESPEGIEDSRQLSAAMPTEQPVSRESTARSDTMTISLSPNEGKEIKLTMAKGSKVEYAWWTDGGRANFDSHADSEKLEIKYHNYSKGAKERSDGVLEAAFDGNHGWFWRNRTSDNMVVTLHVEGDYSYIVHAN